MIALTGVTVVAAFVSEYNVWYDISLLPRVDTIDRFVNPVFVWSSHLLRCPVLGFAASISCEPPPRQTHGAGFKYCLRAPLWASAAFLSFSDYCLTWESPIQTIVDGSSSLDLY